MELDSRSLASRDYKEMVLNQIENIHQDDLSYIEKDLSFNEKISLGFLLFGTTKTNTWLIIQKLISLYKNQDSISDILFSYSRVNKENWKLCLIEALTIMRAHRVLRKLGIDRTEYEVIFLPYNPEASLYIHPVLKALYFVCERLNIMETKALIVEVRKKIADNSFVFSDVAFLEIFLLEWMTRSVIKIGEWPTCTQIDNKSNMSLIISFLKLHEKDMLKRLLETTCNYVNSRIENSFSDQIEKNICGTSKMSLSESDACHTDLTYKVERSTAGFILIINQKDFYLEKDPNLKHLLPENELKERRGTEKDKQMLVETFEQFGYTPYIKNNLKANDILDTVRNFVLKSRFYDSIIICILSHGDEGVIYGTNSIPVQIYDIQNILASSPELYKKPKILLIQACQGSKLQQAGHLEMDSPLRDTQIFYMPKRNEGNKLPAEVEAKIDKKFFGDFLTVLSSVRDYASFRDIETGSWFIQTLCEKINLFANIKHLTDIITIVIGEVSLKKSKANICMVPEMKSTLAKTFWLPKRNL